MGETVGDEGHLPTRADVKMNGMLSLSDFDDPPVSDSNSQTDASNHLRVGAESQARQIERIVELSKRVSEVEKDLIGIRSELAAAMATIEKVPLKKCFKCGSNQHLKKECPRRVVNGGGSGSQKTCGFCNKKGHVQSDCWDKYPHLAPSWYHRKREMKKGDCMLHPAMFSHLP